MAWGVFSVTGWNRAPWEAGERAQFCRQRVMAEPSVEGQTTAWECYTKAGRGRVPVCVWVRRGRDGGIGGQRRKHRLAYGGLVYLAQRLRLYCEGKGSVLRVRCLFRVTS